MKKCYICKFPYEEFYKCKIDKNNIRRIREIVKDRYLLINKKKLQTAFIILFLLIFLILNFLVPSVD